MSKLEALTSWEEWVAETEKKEVETRTTTKFRHERKKRDAFRALLKEHNEAGGTVAHFRSDRKRNQFRERQLRRR